MIKVLPSSNPEKEENLVDYAKFLETLGVEYLHCDVMDGVFVNNKCLSIETIKNIRNSTGIQLDIHLMINNPIKVINQYIEICPNILTIHFESVNNKRDIRKIAKIIHDNDILFGVSIKPETSVSALVEFMDIIDLILIMSVEPGKSGQKFIESSIDKIKDAKCLCSRRDTLIEVDGGINLENYKKVVSSGADFLVMGSLFYNSEDKSGLLYKIDKHYKINNKSK